MKPTAVRINLGAMALALLVSAPIAATVRVSTLSDNGGPAPDLLACVGEAFPLDEREDLGSKDFHAWLFVAKVEGLPAAPHAVHLLLTIDESEMREAQEGAGIPLSFLSWRSFQGDATDAVFCEEVAKAIRAGVADVGPGLRAIRVK